METSKKLADGNAIIMNNVDFQYYLDDDDPKECIKTDLNEVSDSHFKRSFSYAIVNSTQSILKS